MAGFELFVTSGHVTCILAMILREIKFISLWFGTPLGIILVRISQGCFDMTCLLRGTPEELTLFFFFVVLFVCFCVGFFWFYFGGFFCVFVLFWFFWFVFF